MYKKAGITDVVDFYRDKFVRPMKFDFTRNPFNFLDIANFKMLWVYSKVTDCSRVLDFGCGSGTLSCLKDKGCDITGVDLSPEALHVAKQYNGYDTVFCGDIFSFDHERAYFDYVVSVDVFGHIPFEEKNLVIQRLKEYLKPGGVMLHGIECSPINYDALSPEDLTQFVTVDGHVGIEGRQKIIARFKKFFRYVNGAVRYDVVNAAEEYLKQVEEYGVALSEPFRVFLQTLTYPERRIFNISSGTALINMENKSSASRPLRKGGLLGWLLSAFFNQHVHNNSPDDESSGFLFLEASDNPLPRKEIQIPELPSNVDIHNLLEDDRVFFLGWYGVEEREGGPPFRWGMKRAFLYLPGFRGAHLQLSLFTWYPNVSQKPIEVFLMDLTTREVLARVILNSPEPRQVLIPVNADHLFMEIFIDTTWIPRLMVEGSLDERELGIGVEKIQVK